MSPSCPRSRSGPESSRGPTASAMPPPPCHVAGEAWVRATLRGRRTCLRATRPRSGAEAGALGAHAVAPSASVPPSPVLLCGVCRLAFGYGASGGVTPGEEPPRRWAPLRGEEQREAAAARKVSGADGAVTCHLRTPVPPQAPSIPPPRPQPASAEFALRSGTQLVGQGQHSPPPHPRSSLPCGHPGPTPAGRTGCPSQEAQGQAR